MPDPKVLAKAVQNLRIDLLQKRRWAFLRYWHAREAVKLMQDCETVCVVGAGFCLAELALAAEFQDMHFHCTDFDATTHNSEKARRLARELEMRNISFGQLDILDTPVPNSFDAVYSIEVLEHIKDDALAAENMRKMARVKVFCLVPFAEEAKNEDPVKRQYVWEKMEHHVVGYDADRLQELFGEGVIRGVYWRDAGAALRTRLGELPKDMTAPQMAEHRPELIALAERDVRDAIPQKMRDAEGIYIVAHA